MSSAFRQNSFIFIFYFKDGHNSSSDEESWLNVLCAGNYKKRNNLRQGVVLEATSDKCSEKPATGSRKPRFQRKFFEYIEYEYSTQTCDKDKISKPVTQKKSSNQWHKAISNLIRWNGRSADHGCRPFRFYIPPISLLHLRNWRSVWN